MKTIKVEAYPAAVSFQWFFNSSEYEEWKGHEEFSQTGLKSELEFLPKTSKDYGSLFCIGENAIGRQEEACVFQVRKLRFHQKSDFSFNSNTYFARNQ